MSTSRIEEDFFLALDTGIYQEQIGKVIDYFLPQFIKLSRRYILFNLIFLFLLLRKLLRPAYYFLISKNLIFLEQELPSFF